MQFTEPTESLKQYEELKKNQNPSGHKLALRLMEAAGGNGRRLRVCHNLYLGMDQCDEGSTCHYAGGSQGQP